MNLKECISESPFEFRALEVALEAICSFLAARTTELETAAYPALDELTAKVSNHFLTPFRYCYMKCIDFLTIPGDYFVKLWTPFGI